MKKKFVQLTIYLQLEYTIISYFHKILFQFFNDYFLFIKIL